MAEVLRSSSDSQSQREDRIPVAVELEKSFAAGQCCQNQAVEILGDLRIQPEMEEVALVDLAEVLQVVGEEELGAVAAKLAQVPCPFLHQNPVVRKSLRVEYHRY